jgi:pimeloyl-ACP methyl ester carboxylesterase
MDRSLDQEFRIPTTASYMQQGQGRPVILIHGIASSYHNWDDLLPALVREGDACYALDLLGHGDSPKLASRAYQMEWMYQHFSGWVKSLHLSEPAILIGHSLGGYLALEYARRVPAWTHSLVLIDPLYSLSQLPSLLRRSYQRSRLSHFLLERTPPWMFRLIVDMSSVAMGNGISAPHSLPEKVRAQMALDYARTSPGVYNIINTGWDLNGKLSSVSFPTLVIWGDRDQTLAPSSFPRLVNQMPRATGKVLHAGHVPHLSNTDEFNQVVVEFLRTIV